MLDTGSIFQVVGTIVAALIGVFGLFAVLRRERTERVRERYFAAFDDLIAEMVRWADDRAAAPVPVIVEGPDGEPIDYDWDLRIEAALLKAAAAGEHAGFPRAIDPIDDALYSLGRHPNPDIRFTIASIINSLYDWRTGNKSIEALRSEVRYEVDSLSSKLITNETQTAAQRSQSIEQSPDLDSDRLVAQEKGMGR